MGRIIEGVWDCQYCGSKKIRGSIYDCPVCGKTRDKDIKFYIDNPHNYVDNETAKKVSRNPDWLCSYCDSLNPDDVNECQECGASREDSEHNYFERRKIVEEREREKARLHGKAAPEPDTVNGIPVIRGNEPTQPSVQSEPHQQNNGVYSSENLKRENRNNTPNSYNHIHRAQPTQNIPSKKSFNWGKLFGVGAAIMGAIMAVVLLVILFTPKVMDVEVQDFSWNRGINVEELVTVEESDWSLPAGARLKYEQPEIKGYTQVLDHYETKTRTYTEQVLDHYEEYVSGYRDLGNGHFEEITSERPVYRTETKTETYEEPVYRDEPIYATKYYYEIDKWQIQYTSKSSGEDKDPYWNEPALKNNQREGSRSETYYVSFLTDENEVEKYTVDKSLWDKLNKGDKVTIKVSFGHATLAEDE